MVVEVIPAPMKSSSKLLAPELATGAAGASVQEQITHLNNACLNLCCHTFSSRKFSRTSQGAGARLS